MSDSSWVSDSFDRERDNERDQDETHEEWVEAEAWDRIRRQREAQEDTGR